MISDAIDTPLIIGFFKPVMMIPSEILHHLSPSELRTLLAHELIHLKRRDHWVLPFELFARSLHWFNPVVWAVLRRLRAERERACDDAVLRAGALPSDYAEHLLSIVRGVGQTVPNVALAMVGATVSGFVISTSRRVEPPLATATLLNVRVTYPFA